MIDLYEHIEEIFVSTDVSMAENVGFHADNIRKLADPHAAADTFLAASPEEQQRIRGAEDAKAQARYEKALKAPRVASAAQKRRVRKDRPVPTQGYKFLSPSDVIEIVRMRASGVPLSDIVSNFKVARSTIQLRIRAAGLSRSYTKKAAA